ncbi:MAG: sodium:proton antiporter NhaD [Flavobacteriales bacterium]
MEFLVLIIFVLGYLFIALEHKFQIDKAASALLTGTICWGLFVTGIHDVPAHLSEDFEAFKSGLPGDSVHGLKLFLEHRLMHHMEEISNILFFLLGAMTIVELVDAHEGFSVITDRIKTTKKARLIWILSVLTFFFSAVLDNLTTSIVMVSLLRKLVADKETRWLFAGVVVIAANAGGAWSPIGDITTTMLWIGNQLTSDVIIMNLFIPSLVCLIVPLLILSFTMKGEVKRPEHIAVDEDPTTPGERKLVFIMGLAGLLFVPVFKTVTHLPPFMGMMLSLGMMWVITEIIHRSKNHQDRDQLSVIGVLRKIDAASVLFFLGILLAVAALQEIGHLVAAAGWLRDTLGNVYTINLTIGFLSAVVDNVPLVAASMGMYDITAMGSAGWDGFFVQNGVFWQFLAYCAGTGGSALIIGSAAGVAVMGLERIDFVWYLKRISLLAIAGYLAGAGCFWLMFH